jgi:energy-coupling factor transporter ATP-binding protein EcfA2
VDFYRIVTQEKKDGSLLLRPDWKVGRSDDLMTRSGGFYAIWDKERGLWSTDIYDVQRLVDEDLYRHQAELEAKTGLSYQVATMESHGSKLWDEFVRYIRNSGNNSHNLDEKLVFADTIVKREDYASKRLPYSLVGGSHQAWDAVVGTLYNEEERAKIEWAIGAVVSGDSKVIQKFLVFYGPPGSGKSTILNIIGKLFDGYVSVFDARELAGNNNAFATSAFKSNPLVAIQHDGDLSRIYDNTKLNSIVAHEVMTVNEKYKAPFESRSNAFLFMGTNVPVKITDAKSGIIRRLIDVVPTQQTIEHDQYHILMDQIDRELGAIAVYCKQRYLAMGKNYYSGYRPTEMMLQTDVFYNFVEDYFDVFKSEDGVSLRKAYSLYKEFCSETGIDKILPRYKLREELKNYFYVFEDRTTVNGETIRSYYRGFKHLTPPPPKTMMPIKTEGPYRISLSKGSSVFDEMCSTMPAQYPGVDDKPKYKWANVTTTLADIDTSKLHYVKVPENHIVIDFDLTNEAGEKDLERNIEEASKWPATYTEASKSGKGIHLHYTYVGKVEELASVYAEGIEIKTLLGNASLRRQLSLCNSVNITPLEGGLPKKEKPLLANQSIKSEKGLRDLIERNLRKEIHPGTKPSVDFIHKILEEAFESGLPYDVRDMRSVILTFALKSTHQSDQCVKTVMSMRFVSESSMPAAEPDDSPIVFYDVEVYPNLLLVCWKAQGSEEVVRMINPTSEDIEPLFRHKLVGFNNRRYDNHVLYARFLGYSIEDIYYFSQKIINGGNDREVLFGEAYNLSYADIYDFSSKKQGLKKFQIELGITHMELDIPWDEPVPVERWKQVEEYCVNDVISTELVFEARHQDFVARQILAELSGLTVNHTTQAHTAKIIFGDTRDPQRAFVYTDLREEFPGYNFDGKESTYHGEVTGEGGYVYAEPGIYENVAVLDVASMHPTSIKVLNAFGPYTDRFAELTEARVAIKRKEYERARTLLDGKLGKFLVDDEGGADELAYALKIVINIVYGLTSAKFPNAFKDNRNKDNIVAKRGALFMIELKEAVQAEGFQVVHIKTDSIKIPNATPEIIQFVSDFGKSYGYDFEHEVTYDKFCLVNDAVYIAKDGDMWSAVGAQFQHPYVFKTLFSREPLGFNDFCETKNVTQGTMYLDFSESGNVEEMVHVGRTGSFVPAVYGGSLWRVKDGSKFAVTGTKGHLWVTRDVAVARDKEANLVVDMEYFKTLATKAKEAIEKYGDFQSFIS